MTGPEKLVRRIPAANLSAFTRRMDQLRRRATRLNLANPPSWSEVGVDREVLIGRVQDGDHVYDWVPEASATLATDDGSAFLTGKMRSLHCVEVDGIAPRLNGWDLVAVLQDAGEAGHLTFTLPDKELPAGYDRVTCDPTACDHCKTQRTRKQSYLLQHEDGRVAQVGSTCLKDFTGHESPEALAALYADLSSALSAGELHIAETDWVGSGSPESAWNLHGVLAIAAGVVAENGFVSATKARERGIDPTRDEVMRILCSNDRPPFPTPAITAMAEKVLAWGLSLSDRPEERLNDYMFNLRVAFALGMVTPRTMGLICSAQSAMERELSRDLERSQQAGSNGSAHVGVVRQRIDVNLTLLRIRSLPGDWGAVDLHALVDSIGNRFAWFASGRSPWETSDGYAIGDVRAVRATVKRHDINQDRPQTVITRVTGLDVAPEELVETYPPPPHKGYIPANAEEDITVWEHVDGRYLVVRTYPYRYIKDQVIDGKDRLITAARGIDPNETWPPVLDAMPVSEIA